MRDVVVPPPNHNLNPTLTLVLTYIVIEIRPTTKI